MSELKPCPFCGSAEYLVVDPVSVKCINCHASGPFFNDNEDDAIAAWNKRAENEQEKGERKC